MFISVYLPERMKAIYCEDSNKDKSAAVKATSPTAFPNVFRHSSYKVFQNQSLM